MFASQRLFQAQLSATIKTLLQKPPPTATTLKAQGHIKSIRHSKNAGFIDLSDGSSHTNLSVVFKEPLNVLSKLQLKVGQSISVTGEWLESKGSQEYELCYNPSQVDHALEIVGDVPDNYPIQKKSLTFQHLRNHPTLRHRTSTLASLARFRSILESKINDYFAKNDFVKVTPPLITSSDCEGAGEQFQIESLAKKGTGNDPENYFFGQPSYMTVSTQLHLEVLAQSLNRVWTLSPCFRAEVSNTNRHLSEFWMLEAEICYVDRVEHLTSFAQDLIKNVTRELKDGAGHDLIASRFNKDEVAVIKGRWDTILDTEWPQITYTEAIEIINRVMNKGRSKNRVIWGDSISTPHEKWLAGVHFQSPVFITDYPSVQKPFYMPKSANYNPEKPTVACFDLILPEIGELIGGSMREHNYHNLVAAMEERKMNPESMEWYLSTRLNGTVPHGGFGLGFDRLLAYLGAIDNIKDVVAFPRAPRECEC